MSSLALVLSKHASRFSNSLTTNLPSALWKTSTRNKDSAKLSGKAVLKVRIACRTNSNNSMWGSWENDRPTLKALIRATYRGSMPKQTTRYSLRLDIVGWIIVYGFCDKLRADFSEAVSIAASTFSAVEQKVTLVFVLVEISCCNACVFLYLVLRVDVVWTYFSFFTCHRLIIDDFLNYTDMDKNFKIFWSQ